MTEYRNSNHVTSVSILAVGKPNAKGVRTIMTDQGSFVSYEWCDTDSLVRGDAVVEIQYTTAINEDGNERPMRPKIVSAVNI